ncbi:MAG: hypothetical protein ACFFC3_04100 [Candidatus Odinarchaeota archaeon]
MVFAVYSNQIKNFEKKDENYNIQDFALDDFHFLGTINEEIFVNSFEDPQIRDFNNFFERLLRNQEIFCFFFCFKAIYLSFQLLAFFKNISINKNFEDINSLEIEGIRVTIEEMKIFELIQEYLNQNRVFTEDSVISYIKSRSKTNGNLNYNGIIKIIDSLLTKNLIVTGSKFTRKTVLLNTNRKTIYDMIKEYPGIYMNKLSNVLKLSPFVIKWHLSILSKFNLIRKLKLNNKISYFNSSLDTENDKLFNIISKEKCITILTFLDKNNKGYTKNQIAKLLKMHYNTITKYLNEIDKFNLLIKKQANKTEYIYLNENNFKSVIKQS